MISSKGPTGTLPLLREHRMKLLNILPTAFDKTMKDPEVKKKMDQNGFKTELKGFEESLALVKKKMLEYEVIMKELGRVKK